MILKYMDGDYGAIYEISDKDYREAKKMSKHRFKDYKINTLKGYGNWIVGPIAYMGSDYIKISQVIDSKQYIFEMLK